MSDNVIDLEEKRFEKLPPREAGRRLMRLPAKRRLEAIVQRPDAELVVAALPEQDFFFTVKEVGSDDCLPLLALARMNQLNHLFDLEWWQKERVAPAKALEWLERLAGASERKLLHWLYQADFELLVTLFRKWVRAATLPEDTDLLEAQEYLPAHTLDDQYFWESHYPQYHDLIDFVLKLLFEANHGFYVELINNVIWAVGVEVEEDAYRFHRGRLEDLSVPDFYDALEIYRSIRQHEIPHDKSEVATGSAPTAPPSFALALVPEKDLLNRALRRIEDGRSIDAIQAELAALANKVVVADRLSLDDTAGLCIGLGKVAAYVNLGLDLKSGGEVNAAVNLLKEVHLEHLFRLGHTHAAALRNRFRRLCEDGWLSRWPAGIRILDSPWLDAADLLLQRTPQLPRQRTDLHLPPEEDFFREKADLLRGKHFIQVIASLGPLFDSLRVQPEKLHEQLWPGGQLKTLEDVTLGALLLTAAAQHQVEGSWEPIPLPLAAWPELFPRLSPPVLAESIRNWISRVLPVSMSPVSVRAYVNPLLKAYEEEIGRYEQVQYPPDPRMVRFVLFTDG